MDGKDASIVFATPQYASRVKSANRGLEDDEKLFENFFVIDGEAIDPDEVIRETQDNPEKYKEYFEVD